MDFDLKALSSVSLSPGGEGVKRADELFRSKHTSPETHTPRPWRSPQGCCSPRPAARHPAEAPARAAGGSCSGWGQPQRRPPPRRRQMIRPLEGALTGSRASHIRLRRLLRSALSWLLPSSCVLIPCLSVLCLTLFLLPLACTKLSAPLHWHPILFKQPRMHPQ